MKLLDKDKVEEALERKARDALTEPFSLAYTGLLVEIREGLYDWQMECE
jgi:hypothetical protein